MTEQYWVSLRDDGLVEQQVLSEKRPAGGGWHKVDRLGDLARETWKPRSGWKALEGERVAAAIDAGHRADHGHHGIALARAVKEIEARLIMSGVPIPGGRVEQEAAALGRDVGDVAAEILRQADADTADLERIVAKAKVRGVRLPKS